VFTFPPEDGRVEGVVVDRTGNDRMMEVMWRKRGEKEEVREFLA
jgi:hypothetical protein